MDVGSCSVRELLLASRKSCPLLRGILEALDRFYTREGFHLELNC